MPFTYNSADSKKKSLRYANYGTSVVIFMSLYPRGLGFKNSSIIRNLPGHFFRVIFGLRVCKSRWLHLVNFLDRYEIIDVLGQE